MMEGELFLELEMLKTEEKYLVFLVWDFFSGTVWEVSKHVASICLSAGKATAWGAALHLGSNQSFWRLKHITCG